MLRMSGTPGLQVYVLLSHPTEHPGVFMSTYHDLAQSGCRNVDSFELSYFYCFLSEDQMELQRDKLWAFASQAFQNSHSPQTVKKDICLPGFSPDLRWRGWKRFRAGLSTSPWWRVPRTLSAGWNVGCREKGRTFGLWPWNCHSPSRATDKDEKPSF